MLHILVTEKAIEIESQNIEMREGCFGLCVRAEVGSEDLDGCVEEQRLNPG